jgi:hypothetical protein
MNLAEVLTVYTGSSGDATKAMYERLGKFGPAGEVAVNLFRACKSSERAKVYRGGGFRGMAYDRKQWAMDNLARVLVVHAEALGIRWGWREDPAQGFHRIVLYIDLPTGQVSFHTANRGEGPGYPDEWDGVRKAGPERICRWIVSLFEGQQK